MPPSSLPEAAGSRDDSFIICQKAGIWPLRFYMPFGRTGVLCLVLKMWPASKSVLPWEKWKSLSKKAFSFLCPETAELRTVSTTGAVTEIPISMFPQKHNPLQTECLSSQAVSTGSHRPDWKMAALWAYHCAFEKVRPTSRPPQNQFAEPSGFWQLI